MTRSARLAILIVGLLILACSLAALAYAVWPVPELTVQATLSPTLFAPP